MMILAVVALIALLVVLIAWGKVPPFLAFLVVALGGALAFGMSFE